MLAAEHGERGGEAGKRDVLHFELEALDRADGILDATGEAVDDVHVHGKARAGHPDGVHDAALVVDHEMLADGVENLVLRRNVDRLGIAHHVLRVLVGDEPVGRDDGMHAAIADAVDVIAGDAEINRADLDTGHRLGFRQCGADILFGRGQVGDLPLAHAARPGLPQADDVQRTLLVHFADDGADLGGADLESDDDLVGAVKHCVSWVGGPAWAGTGFPAGA